MAITKKMLKAIKAALPHGSITEIAEENKVSKVLVGKVLSGEVKINKANIKFIHAAQKKIKLWKTQQKKLANTIRKTLSSKN